MSLFHPAHVVEALDRLDDINEEEFGTVLGNRNRRSAAYVPSEAVIRLLRRARVEADRRREHLLVAEIVERVRRWSRRSFRGLRDDDRDEFVQEVLLRIFRDVGRQDDIDYWEITFDRNLGRTAADVYQQHFARLRQEQGQEKQSAYDEDDDGGRAASDLETWALCVKGASSVLDEREMVVFHPMFTEGIPIASEKAAIDLVRLTGIPEGTLREMKTRMTNKLRNADAGRQR